MEKLDFTEAGPIAQAEMPGAVNRQAPSSEDRAGREVKSVVRSNSFLVGVIIDSWVESESPENKDARLVLQVAPRGYPEVVVNVEAEASLVSDPSLLEGLRENLCHGNTVLAFGTRLFIGLFTATRLHLM